MLAILSEFGGFSSIGKPVLYWRGKWAGGGLAAQKAFSHTNHGPRWISHDKQVMARSGEGPVSVSGEYEAQLLGQIGDQYIGDIETQYHVDPGKDIDRLYIIGKDTSGSTIVIVHDFKTGEGGDFVYTGMTPTAFVRSPNELLSMRDANGRQRLWTGASNGRFYQAEDGDSDNGSAYTADMIAPLNLGPKPPELDCLEFSGDSQLEITYTTNLLSALADLDALAPIQPVKEDDDTEIWQAPVEETAQFMLLRIKLTSDHTRGTLANSSPLHIPLETYGRCWMMRPRFGIGEREGRTRH
jgi:hypothetical protein